MERLTTEQGKDDRPQYYDAADAVLLTIGEVADDLYRRFVAANYPKAAAAN